MKKRNIIILIVVILIIVAISFTLFYLENKNDSKESDINQTSNTEIINESSTTENDSTESSLTTETTSQFYSITTETYSQDNDNIRVQYPQITEMEDASMKNTVNKLIENDVDERNKEALHTTGLTVDETYQVKMYTNELLSILTTRTFFNEGSEHSNTYLYGTTIDLKTGTKLQLSDFMNVDAELAQMIKQSTDVTNAAVDNGMDKNKLIAAIQQILNSDIFFGLQEGWNSYTFYLTPDSLVISLGVPYDVGEYALIKLLGQYTPK